MVLDEFLSQAVPNHFFIWCIFRVQNLLFSFKAVNL